MRIARSGRLGDTRARARRPPGAAHASVCTTGSTAPCAPGPRRRHSARRGTALPSSPPRARARSARPRAAPRVRRGGGAAAPAEGARAPRGRTPGLGRRAGTSRRAAARTRRTRPGRRPGDRPRPAAAGALTGARVGGSRRSAVHRRADAARGAARAAQRRGFGHRPAGVRRAERCSPPRPRPRSTSLPVGVVAPEVRAQAESLSGPIAVYEWVRNTIRPELYDGVMKGPVPDAAREQRERRRHGGTARGAAARKGDPGPLRARHRRAARLGCRCDHRNREPRSRAARPAARGDPERGGGGRGRLARHSRRARVGRGVSPVWQLPRRPARRAREGVGPARSRVQAPLAAGRLRRAAGRLRSGCRVRRVPLVRRDRDAARVLPAARGDGTRRLGNRCHVRPGSGRARRRAADPRAPPGLPALRRRRACRSGLRAARLSRARRALRARVGRRDRARRLVPDPRASRPASHARVRAGGGERRGGRAALRRALPHAALPRGGEARPPLAAA